jgi:hypothetical protein
VLQRFSRVTVRAKTFLALVSTTLVLSGALILADAACSSDAATPTIEPITGIQIRAESLLAGKGCGKKTTQALKYAAVVKDAEQRVRAAGIYDCFADALFQELVASGPDGGSPNFVIDVYVFNATAYEAAGNAEKIRDAIGKASGGQAPDPAALPSTWATVCRATEQPNIESIALCDPLASPEATTTVRVGTESFSATSLDGGALPAVACGADFTAVRAAVRGVGILPPPVVDAGTDAAADAGDASADGGDAGDGGLDAGPSDAGSGMDAAADGGAGDGTKTASCPDPIDFTVPAPADHVLDVELLNGVTVVGRTTCTASASPRVQAVATCKPVVR